VNVFIVHLRRPRLDEPEEKRSDPFWEFGSFGVTGCHSKNLLHKKNTNNLEGARFAFAQGGHSGFKLLFVTPPVHVKEWDSALELRWTPREMPFRYDSAPLLIDNNENTDFPALFASVSHVARSTPNAKFSSSFRSRSTPLDQLLAEELVTTYERRRRSRTRFLADTYDEALPYPPPKIDRSRRQTYNHLLEEIGGLRKRSKPRC
jgi:hypothetical protein